MRHSRVWKKAGRSVEAIRSELHGAASRSDGCGPPSWRQVAEQKPDVGEFERATPTPSRSSIDLGRGNPRAMPSQSPTSGFLEVVSRRDPAGRNVLILLCAALGISARPGNAEAKVTGCPGLSLRQWPACCFGLEAGSGYAPQGLGDRVAGDYESWTELVLLGRTWPFNARPTFAEAECERREPRDLRALRFGDEAGQRCLCEAHLRARDSEAKGTGAARRQVPGHAPGDDRAARFTQLEREETRHQQLLERLETSPSRAEPTNWGGQRALKASETERAYQPGIGRTWPMPGKLASVTSRARSKP